MEFQDVIDKRRTIRDFSDEPIPDEIIRKVISTALKAPTNDHMRDWHYIVIHDKAVVKELISHIPMRVSREEVECVLRAWNLNDPCQQNAYIDAIPKQYRMLLDASAVIIPLLKQKTDILHPDNLSHLNGFASIWCSIENLFLAATDEGYACTLRIPLGDEGEYAHEVLGIPHDYLMPCFVGMGRPAPDYKQIEQIPIDVDKHIHNNHW